MSNDLIPYEYEQAGLFMIISGAVNIAYGAGWMLMGLTTCVGTYGLCFMCIPLSLVPPAIGIAELVVGLQIRSGQRVPYAHSVAITTLVLGALSFNVVTVVLEALAMAALGRPEVRDYVEG